MAEAEVKVEAEVGVGIEPEVRVPRRARSLTEGTVLIADHRGLESMVASIWPPGKGLSVAGEEVLSITKGG